MDRVEARTSSWRSLVVSVLVAVALAVAVTLVFGGLQPPSPGTPAGRDGAAGRVCPEAGAGTAR